MPTVTCRITNLIEFAHTWERVHVEFGRACFLGVQLGGQEAVKESLRVRRWKDRTGESKSNLRSYAWPIGYGGQGYFEANFEHASYLDSGTVDHDIVPRSAAGKSPAKRMVRGRAHEDVGTHRVALRWYDAGGQAVFARKVHVKGIRGDGFFGAGTQKLERVIVREVELGNERAQKILDQ